MSGGHWPRRTGATGFVAPRAASPAHRSTKWCVGRTLVSNYSGLPLEQINAFLRGLLRLVACVGAEKWPVLRRAKSFRLFYNVFRPFVPWPDTAKCLLE